MRRKTNARHRRSHPRGGQLIGLTSTIACMQRAGANLRTDICPRATVPCFGEARYRKTQRWNISRCNPLNSRLLDLGSNHGPPDDTSVPKPSRHRTRATIATPTAQTDTTTAAPLRRSACLIRMHLHRSHLERPDNRLGDPTSDGRSHVDFPNGSRRHSDGARRPVDEPIIGSQVTQTRSL